MEYNYYKMKEKNRYRIERMYKRRRAGLMTREQFFSVIDSMIHKEDVAASFDHYGTCFLADLATDRLRTSGLTESDDLWPWISKTFRVCWKDWCDNPRLFRAVRLACIRVFRDHDQRDV